jgi:uncharacterized membrane protein required for colicin V production
MLDLILLVLLIGGFIVGIRRGLILQVVHLTGFIAAFVIAYLYFDKLAPKLKLWIPYPTTSIEPTLTLFMDALNLETAYYNAIAFAILFFGTKIVVQIIGSMLDFLADLPFLRTINRWSGGALGFVEVYLVVFIFLYIAALVPVQYIQTSIEDSFMAKTIVENTPVFSEKVKELWMSDTSV